MTISLTKGEADLILQWVSMEHSDGAFITERLDNEFLDDVRKNTDSIEEKVKFAKTKENLKKVTRELNKIPYEVIDGRIKIKEEETVI